MRTCVWCGGKGITGQLIHGEDGTAIIWFGRELPMVTVVDRPCSKCKGTGKVTEDEYRRLTGVKR